MKNKINNIIISAVEKGIIPDFLIRYGIKLLLKRRLIDIKSLDCEKTDFSQMQMISRMQSSPIAINTDSANEQHYEVPQAFYKLILGSSYKYSCCHWSNEVHNLDDAEKEALDITCDRAQINNGMNVLDLGCGWGSLSLWIAEKFPECSVTSVSNSKSQHDFIHKQASLRNLNNIKVIVADMNDFKIDQKFDRIISLEMFEHMKNYQKLYHRISKWLSDDGLFLMHIFCHKSSPYDFVDKGPNDWMSRYFFTGGIMPSDDLPLFFQESLLIKHRWRWSGEHYAKTSNAWLENMDKRKAKILPIIESTYGRENMQKWWQRWRIFFMSCAELFAFNGGQEWYVNHYLFEKKIQTCDDE